MIRRKAKVDKMNVPDDVVEYIAKNVQSTMRDLEGALMRVMVYSSIMNQEMSVELASQALGKADHATVITTNGTQRVVIDDTGTIYRTYKHNSNDIKNKNPFFSDGNLGCTESGSTVKHELQSEGSPHDRRAAPRITLGVIHGAAVAVATLLCLVLTAVLIDYVLHLMGLIRPDISLLWWSTVALNVLTILIPYDVFRFLKKKSNGLFAQIRLWSFTVLEFVGIVITVTLCNDLHSILGQIGLLNS